MTYKHNDLKIEYEITMTGIELKDVRDSEGNFVSINMKEQSLIKDRIRDEKV